MAYYWSVFRACGRQKPFGCCVVAAEPRCRFLAGMLLEEGEAGSLERSGRMVEITPSQKEKYSSARMKKPVMVLKS